MNNNEKPALDAANAQPVAPEPQEKPANVGRIEWIDLTVDDASRLRNFYKAVVGWTSSDVPMGSYDDFNMNAPGTQDAVAGVCHARGMNRNVPSQWLIYVRVASAAESAAQCTKMGGKVLDGPRRMGGRSFCVIQDPAGAVMAVMSDK